MSNEDFQTQSDGFWTEAARMSRLPDFDNPDQLSEEAVRIRQHLIERFTAIQNAGPTARQSMLSHLAAGGSLQKDVDTILGSTSDGKQLSVVDFLHGNVQVNPQTGSITVKETEVNPRRDRNNPPPTPQPPENPSPAQPADGGTSEPGTQTNDDGTTDLGTIEHDDNGPT